MFLKTPEASHWTNCFEINATISAASYFGFSAMTGGVSSRHDITQIDTYSLKVHSLELIVDGSKLSQEIRGTQEQGTEEH